MANEEQLVRLKEGVEGWNQWRYDNRELKINLYQADLRDADLVGANLNRADLREANLIGANLSEADLSGNSWAFWDFLLLASTGKMAEQQ
jgi:uncharacterized protein YjbI with pentapeptide repeats